MTKAFVWQLIILVIFSSLSSCGGNSQKSQSDTPKYKYISDSGKVNKASSKAAAKADTAIFCSDSNGQGFDSEGEESYAVFLKNQKGYFKGKTELSDESVKRKLFLGIDSIPADLSPFSKSDTIPTDLPQGGKTEINKYISDVDFHLIGTILKNPGFNGIVYEEIRDYSSHIYFSTVDRRGKFISRVLLSFYGQDGTYLDNEGAKHAYFIGTNGCVYQNYIEVYGNNGTLDNEYNIHSDGQVVNSKKDRFDSLLRVAPNNAETHLNYARYLEFSDDDGAKKQFEQALKLKPGSAAIYNEFAHFISVSYTDTVNAKRYYEKAIELAPDSAGYHWNYGDYLSSQLKDDNNANVQYQKAIALVPNSSLYHLLYADFIFDKFHLTKEARQHYLKAIKLDPILKSKDENRKYGVPKQLK